MVGMKRLTPAFFAAVASGIWSIVAAMGRMAMTTSWPSRAFIMSSIEPCRSINWIATPLALRSWTSGLSADEALTRAVTCYSHSRSVIGLVCLH